MIQELAGLLKSWPASEELTAPIASDLVYQTVVGEHLLSQKQIFFNTVQRYFAFSYILAMSTIFYRSFLNP